MTKVYIADTTHSITVDEAVYTVEIANSAADTTVTTSGSGTSLINTSSGGTHVLNSLTAGANVTLTDDNNGNLTIAATEDNLSNNTTSDLPEGSNLYYTDARVDTALTTVGGNIIPATDNTQYLGSSSKRWHSLYLGPGTLYIDDHPVLGSDDENTINFTTDTGQTIDIFAGGGSGTAGAINMASRSNTTTLNDTTVNLGPSVGGGSINARGTLEAPDLHNGDLEFSGTLINQTGTNQNLEIRTNGTGYIHWNSADVYVGPIAGAVKIDEGSITTTAGNLTISATGTVDVAGHNTTAETAALIATAKTEAIASAESKDAVRATAANAYADAAVGVLTSGASAAFDTLVEIKTLMDSGDATLNTAIGNLNHDTLSGFVANEHIDWTTDQGSTNIHAGNYTDTNTVYTDAEAISAVEGESTLDLTGTVTIGDLEFTNYSQFGENFGKLKATGTNQNLCLQATDGTGYFVVNSPNQYFGAASGVKITNAAGSATTLSGFGYQSEALNITGDLSGDLTKTTTTTENLTTKNVKANPSSVTIPAAYGGSWDYSADTGHALVGIGKFQTGHPIVGITQTDNVNESQPKAMFLVNHMDYDHSGSGSALGGYGVSVDFNVQDEAGNLHQLGQNLVKLRNVTTGGSSGSSTITGYDSEYTLTTFSSGFNQGTNSLTSNKDFTEVTQELRVVDKPVNSGSTALSGIYLTYDGAETGTPTAKIQLRDDDDDTTTNLMTLEEDRVSQQVVHKQYKASSDPSGEAGDTYFNTTTNKFRGHNGTAWVDIGG